MNDMNRVFNDSKVKEVLERFPNLSSYFLRLQDSDNFKNMIYMPDIVIKIIQYIDYNSQIFKFEYHYDFVNGIIDNVFKLLESENFKNCNIFLEDIYKIIDRFIVLYNDPNQRLRVGFVEDKSFDMFFEIVCNLKCEISIRDFKLLCDSLGSPRDMFLNIGRFFVKNIKQDDQDINRRIVEYIEKYVICNSNQKEYLDLSYPFFMLCKYYIEGHLNKERFNSITSLINKFYNESKEQRKSSDKIGQYVNGFIEILKSNNFKKGIIPNEYLEEFFKCDNFVQIRTMLNLLICEYYEEGFITEEHIKLVNNKEYIIITHMLYSILLDLFTSSEEDKYNWILGILNLDDKKQLCEKLYSCIDRDIDEKYIAYRFLQLNIFFPKFDVKPFAKKKVPENDN